MRCDFLDVHYIRTALLCFLLAVVIALAGCGSGRSSNVPAVKPAPAGQQSVSRASLGYVWGAGGSGLRQIRGVTGASYFGPVAYGDYTSAVSSGSARHALLVRTNSDLALVHLPDGIPEDLGAGLSPAEHLMLSPSGSAAVVYADGASLLLITGLPDAPSVQTLSLASVGPISAATVSDDGLLLVLTRKNGAQLVSSLSSDGTPNAIIVVAVPGGMSFLKSGEDALVADAGQNVVWLIKGVGSSPTVTKVATASDGVSQPVAVSASGDRRWVIVANGQPHTILRVDLSQRQPVVAAECPCVPTELAPLAGNAVFRLNSGSSVPVWVFDGDAATPKTFSIPIPAASRAGVN